MKIWINYKPGEETEPSEEVRLEMMRIIAAILTDSPNQTKSNRSELFRIIQYGFADKYHEVKRNFNEIHKEIYQEMGHGEGGRL